jgi:hypothetical protein
MSKVFVPQQNLVRGEGGAMRPAFDLSPATEYGELVYLFGPGQIALQPEAVVDGISARLDELEFDPEQDYLLATGDVTVYGEVYRQMVDRDGVRVLRWDGRYRRYNVINFQGAINE